MQNKQYLRAARVLNKDKCNTNVEGFENELKMFLSQYMRVTDADIQVTRIDSGMELRICVKSTGFINQGKAI
ncbi:MAG TPA: hypothetical protein PK675_01575 [Clostridia bacterium]|nr:hypothetical protein [Clostridia bacterium]